MAEVFFQQFDFKLDYKLKMNAIDPLSLMSEMMVKLGALMSEIKLDVVLPLGDVNYTIVTAFAVNKLGVVVGHIESGLSSFDRGVPEEINRILTDRISDCFFVTEQSGIDNLNSEGSIEDHIHFVGTL